MRRTQDEPGLTYSLRSDWILGQGRPKIQAVRNGALGCQLADQTHMTYIKRFAKSLRKHKTGLCNYAKYQLTSARIEEGECEYWND